MRFTGYYINLDQSTNRRQAMERQLADLHLMGRYNRFPAFDAAASPISGATTLTQAEMACFRSHAEVLSVGQAANGPIHIVEDDAVLSPHCVPLLDGMCGSGTLDGVDILFTETYVPFDLNYLVSFKTLFNASVERGPSGNVSFVKQVQFLELRGRIFAGLTSYLVSATAVPKLAARLREELARGPTMPVDLFVRQLINEGVFQAKCIFPFVTSIRIDAPSTISGRYSDPMAVLASMLLRHSFFVGCDWRQVAELAQQRLGGGSAPQDPHGRLFATICDYILSTESKSF